MQNGSEFVPFAVIIFWFLIISRAWRVQSSGKKTKVTLMEYQGGILFSRGLPKATVGPGKHTVFQGRDFIVYVDLRPRPLNFERRGTGLADHSAVLYDVFATVKISDVKKAIYCARDTFQGAAAAILCCTRAELNRATREQLATNAEAVTRDISALLQRRLGDLGFQLESLRISNIKLMQAAHAVSGFGNEIAQGKAAE